MSKFDMIVNTYDPADRRGENPEERKVYLSSVARALRTDPAQVAALLDDYVNVFADHLELGRKVGREMHRSHRTLQRSEVLFLLGMLCGLAEQWPDWTDPRNERAIEAANKVRELVEAGELYCGPMV